MRGVDVGNEQVNDADDFIWDYGRYGSGAYVVVVEDEESTVHRQKVMVTKKRF